METKKVLLCHTLHHPTSMWLIPIMFPFSAALHFRNLNLWCAASPLVDDFMSENRKTEIFVSACIPIVLKVSLHLVLPIFPGSTLGLYILHISKCCYFISVGEDGGFNKNRNTLDRKAQWNLSPVRTLLFWKSNLSTDILKKKSNRMTNRRVFDSKDQAFSSQKEWMN